MEIFLYISIMINNIKQTDRIVVDLEMLQIDFNEQKKASLRKEIAKKYGLPLRIMSKMLDTRKT